MPAVLHGAAAQALGWALIHFLWEGAAVAALLAAVLYLGRPVSAKVRYGAACIALAAMLAAFGVTLAVLWPAPPVTITLRPAMRFAVPAASLPLSPPPPAPPPDRLSWIVPLWMAGVLIFYARTAGGWLAAQRLRGRAATPAAPEWQERLRALAARLRVTRPVVLLESCLAESPVMMGFLHPVILVPAGLLAGLAPGQLEAILLHELAHIRRHDYAVNLLQSLVEGLLFYHPAVWWISGIVRAERENCCDDAVVAVRGDARGYAAALAALESLRSAGQPALAAKGGNLMRRIHRLLEPERPRSAAAPVLAAILLLLPLAWALAAWPPAPTPGQQGRAPATAPTGAAPVRERTVPALDRTAAAPPAGILLAQAAPPNTQERPASGAEAEYRDFILFYPAPVALSGPYRKWLDEDVAYIIADEERQAFTHLNTDAEREQFIEQFWLRRDPTPGTIENEYKEEHYRRIAYANEHFAAGIPGWRTDRGHIYIVYGPPDEIEDHSAAVAPEVRYQRWRYRLIQFMGQNVTIEFVDPTRSGEYRMTMDPSEKDALLGASAPLAIGVEIGARLDPKFPPHPVTISVPVKAGGKFKISGRMRTPSSGQVPVYASFQETITADASGAYRKRIGAFPAGSYRIEIELTDLTTNGVRRGASDFRVEDNQAGNQVPAPAQAAQGAVPQFQRLEQFTRLSPPPAVRLSDRDAEVGIEVAPDTLSNDPIRAVTIYVYVKTTGEFNIFGRVIASNQRRLVTFEDTVKDVNTGIYRKVVALAPGSYTLDVALKSLATGETSNVRREFQVADLKLANSIESIRAKIADLEKRLAESRADIAKTERAISGLSSEEIAKTQAQLTARRQALQMFEEQLPLLRDRLREYQEACILAGSGLCEAK